MSIIAMDLGGTRIKTGLVSKGIVEQLSIWEIEFNENLSHCLPQLKIQIADLQSQDRAVEGIGIAFPGLVDTDQNKVIDTNGKYSDAAGLDLQRWAAEELGLKLRLENDARLACMGEWKYGAGKGSSDVVMCTLGTGVGSSAVIDGKILRGKHFQAGVLGGHSVIDFNNLDRRCSCGKFGCVEALASTWAVRDMAIKHRLFKESQLKTAAKIDLSAIFECSETGDELAVLIRAQCMKVWSVGIVNLIHAYDPEVVVIGGGIMHAKEILLPYFRNEIQQQAWCPSGVPELKSADYPDTAALLGASLLFD